MKIARATTPTIICTFENEELDFTTAAHVYFIISQSGQRIIKSDDELTIEEKTIEVYLSQQDTLQFNSFKPCEIEVNWTFSNGDRGKSEIINIEIDKTLLPEVLP